MNEPPTSWGVTQGSLFDDAEISFRPSSESTRAMQSSPTRNEVVSLRQRDDDIIKKTLDPCSPSPRGIDNFNPSSPFNLPDPSLPLHLLGPSDISNVLDGTIRFSDHLPVPSVLECVLDTHQQTNLNSYNTTEEVPNNNNEIKLSTQGSDNDHDRLETINLGQFDNHPNPIPVHKGTDTFQTLKRGQKLRNDMPTPSETLKGFPVTMESMFKARDHHNENDFGIASGNVNAKFNNGENFIKQNSFQSEPHELIKVTRINSGNDGYGDIRNLQDTDKQEQGLLNRKISEEEAKRIRRVKNRASVEKCRTKQRLRMEALQSELKTLEYENKTLRDLTTWIDSSVKLS